MNRVNIEEIKQFRDLTLEWGRGETYRSNKPTLYGHGTYGRGSVLRGQSRRVFLESWDTIEDAKAELKAAKIRYTDLTGTGGSTHIPVAQVTSHLPDDSDY